ncbi:hypothetical protein [Desulfuribacillus alkaliarsenatis]|uniref:Uncharacterized protein n=1 Tax=Desulfuribacillus alkaliarsenatis TaxID=766136 RepID=A0A1E5G390_9FIRM|nr:hypothetical protein [Desulfuribacillus alkaliarsenatis]OEF97062.1 hypothetical protein BHF68_05535 [Desulfuribacillus alkaliarsenatis]
MLGNSREKFTFNDMFCNWLNLAISSFIVIFVFSLWYNLLLYNSQQEKYENLFSDYVEVREENEILSTDYKTFLNQTAHLEKYIGELRLNIEEILYENAHLKEANYALRKKHQ